MIEINKKKIFFIRLDTEVKGSMKMTFDNDKQSGKERLR